MKLLVVGGSSFIGKNLVRRVPKEWDVTATYNNYSHFPDFVKSYPHIKPLKVDLTKDEGGEEPNVTKGSFLEEGLGQSRFGGNFDNVVYLAANTDTMGSRENPLYDLKINVLGIFQVINSLRNLKRFIYLSSGAVYFLDKGHHQILPYAISKRTGEEYVKFFAEREGFDYTILRLYETYGRFNGKHKMIRRLCETFERGETSFDIKGDGSNLVDTLYIDDAIEGLLKVIQSDTSNVTVDFCKENITIREMVERIAKVYGAQARFNYSGKATEAGSWKVDPKPLKDLFGFEATISLEEGIARWRAEGIA